MALCLRLLQLYRLVFAVLAWGVFFLSVYLGLFFPSMTSFRGSTPFFLV